MQEDYGVELKILTEKFKLGLKQIATYAKTWAKQTEDNATVQPKVKGYRIADTMKLFNETNEETQEGLHETTNQFENLGNVSVKQTQKMVANFDKLGKNTRRFMLSLFSIRSIWALISRASSTYLSENEQVNQSVRLTASIFGNILAPVIKKVVDIAQYGAIIIAKIIQLFTGYNALAGVTANAMKGVTKAGKEMNKSLASFDTITNLGDNASGIAGGIADSVKALDDFQEKIKKVEEVFKKYEPIIKGATVALGVLFGVSMLQKISSILGTAGTGAAATGASGLLGVLSVIALLAVNAVVIPIAVKGADKAIKEGKSLNEMLEKSKSLSQGLAEQTNKTADEFEQLALSGNQTNEWLNNYYNYLVKVIESNEEENKRLEKQNTLAGKLTGTWKAAQQQQQLNNETNAKMIEKLKTLNKFLEDENLKLDKNSEKYKTNKQMIEQTKEKIQELTSKNYSTTVELKMDTKQAEKSYASFTSRLGASISAALNPANWGSGYTDKVKKAWTGASYAVGTNYVPNDQLAMVHKGEMIVPAKYNPSTNGIAIGNDDVIRKLDQLITTLENKEMNTYISSREIGETATRYINNQTRITGRSALV